MTVTHPHARDVTGIASLEHHTGLALFATELDRTLALLTSLGPDDWSLRTECPAWDVRQMYLHVLGACESGASTRELVHQLRRARRHQNAHGGAQEAALSSVQVAEREHLSPTDLVDRLAHVAPVCVRARTRLPGLLRRATMAVDGPVHERWSLGYLVDTIYLRDAWMHRIDASRATGRQITLTPEHDGVIVADVVAEWARRHGQRFRLSLTGAAGGRFRGNGATTETDEPEMDAVQFARTLAGREPGDGLLATIVPF